MAEQEDQKSKATDSALAVIEKAWDGRWAMRIVCAVLFLDTALVLQHGQGLLGGLPQLLDDVGFLVVVAAAFCLVMAIGMPVLVMLGLDIFMWINAGIDRFFLKRRADAASPYQRSPGEVRPTMVQDLALRERSDFVLGLYERHCRRRDQARRDLAEIGALTVAVFALALANWWIASGVGVIDRLENALFAFSPTLRDLTVLAIALGGFMILNRTWFPKWKPDYLYFPPLEEEMHKRDGSDGSPMYLRRPKAK